MVKGIELHEKQIEAINNGATAFIMMPNKPATQSILRLGEVVVCDDLAIVIIGYMPESHSKKYKCMYLHNNVMFTEYENIIDKVGILPLQVGQKFFVQEEFKEIKEAIKHIEEVIKTCNSKCRTEHAQLKKWLEELIFLKQSRIKGAPTSIEVKRVKDITRGEADKILPLKPISIVNFTHNDWFDEIYGQGTYESNPYVFIVTFEKE